MVWLIHAADVRVPTANAKESHSGYSPEAVEATPAATQKPRPQARASAAPSIVDAKVEEVKRGMQLGALHSALYCVDEALFHRSPDMFPGHLTSKSLTDKARQSVADMLDRNSLSSRMGLFLIAVKRLFDERSGEDGLVDADTASGEANADVSYRCDLIVRFPLQLFCRSSSRTLFSFLRLERAFEKLGRKLWISHSSCAFLRSTAV